MNMLHAKPWIKKIDSAAKRVLKGFYSYPMLSTWESLLLQVCCSIMPKDQTLCFRIFTWIFYTLCSSAAPQK